MGGSINSPWLLDNSYALAAKIKAAHAKLYDLTA